ncbi:hypothetical protein ACFE04_030620 [Oxalis oulophora]
MRRNVNLELSLLPHSVDSWSNNNKMEETNEKIPEEQLKTQQLTIFYNGGVCVSNVTDLQARAIIRLANGGEMDENLSVSRTNYGNLQSPLNHQMASPNSSALQMKRSLQRFLQKRKHRAQSASPY